jgi:hypothetical protein
LGVPEGSLFDFPAWERENDSVGARQIHARETRQHGPRFDARRTPCALANARR